MSASRNASRRMGERERLLAVAPPLAPDDLSAVPDPASITAFRISGPIGFKLHRGTWHADRSSTRRRCSGVHQRHACE
jgi:ureidoglycolate hydrolase